ncbi:MAG: hypothetical protein EA360_06690 [Balneolaceae bacterium]|nr:MAG: hypothetical protein EA360_06690 [Balneolaceae bacterium]
MKKENRVRNIEPQDWIEIIHFITDPALLDIQKIERWMERCSHITVALPESSDLLRLPEGVNRMAYNREMSRATIWNRLARTSHREWILFLLDDEEPDFDTLPDRREINRKKWAPLLIRQKNQHQRGRQLYQMRLVCKTDSAIFDGHMLPDATRYISSRNIKLTEKPAVAYRESELFADVNEEEEMRVRNISPSLYLVLGYHLLHERKIAYAAANFRKLLKMETLLPFDRLAAVNGLMSCFTEQYKWDRALYLANEAIQAEPRQYLPYLVKFKIFQLNKQWNEAIGVLKIYQEILCSEGYSHASFEKYISEEQTFSILGELAMKTGLRKEALVFYEKLCRLKSEDVDQELLHTLLVLSIELLDYEKAVFYFKQIFAASLPDKLSPEMNEKLNDYLSMFMVNGWYDYPSEVYDLLYEQESENGEYRRRLIVTLTKTDRLERARKLIVKNL